jgi:hypothetical protein
MKTLDIEELANRNGPESCAAGRKGGGEALTGVRAGSVSSREIKSIRVPRWLATSKRLYRWSRYREWPADPARS